MDTRSTHSRQLLRIWVSTCGSFVVGTAMGLSHVLGDIVVTLVRARTISRSDSYLFNSPHIRGGSVQKAVEPLLVRVDYGGPPCFVHAGVRARVIVESVGVGNSSGEAITQ